jgi:hypothetical protein
VVINTLLTGTARPVVLVAAGAADVGADGRFSPLGPGGHSFLAIVCR